MRTRDLVIILSAKALRTFGFGYISVITALFLSECGLSSVQIGSIFTATLIEDAVLTTALSIAAGRFGSRRLLMLAPLMIVLAGLVMGSSQDTRLLAVAAVFGIISPSGQEGGPFSALEQALLPGFVKAGDLTRAFSWYNLAGFFPAALGALVAGMWLGGSSKIGLSSLQSYRALFLLYAFSGLVLSFLYASLKQGPGSESSPPSQQSAPRGRLQTRLGLHRSTRYVFELAALYSIDSFAGGFIVQSLIAYWFHLRYHIGAEVLGPLFCATNFFATLSFLAAPYIAARAGLLRTMVLTHLPCSLSLCLVPLMPSFSLAAAVLLLRSLFSSMDVPTRQAYAMTLVDPDERSAAAGITMGARSISQGMAPLFSGLAMSNAATGMPFYIAGILKSVYDLSIYFRFRKIPLKM